MTSYILFIMSLLGLSILFSAKILEMERGRVVISEDIKNHIEKKTKKHLSVLYVFASHFNKRTIIKILRLLYEELKFFSLKIYHVLLKKIKNSDIKIIKTIMGKKILRRNGEVSPFLNDIAEFKRENGLDENKEGKDLNDLENLI